jgi:dUTP pyrophosphatase
VSDIKAKYARLLSANNALLDEIEMLRGGNVVNHFGVGYWTDAKPFACVDIGYDYVAQTADVRVRIVGKVPVKGSIGASGFDLVADIAEPIVLYPGMRCRFGSGIKIELPPGWEAQVRSRSGLSTKHGIQVVNAPGTIDSDYRGEIGVPLINLGNVPFVVEPGMRIAQLVVQRVPSVEWVQVDSLESSERGECGFGSTGV